MEIQPSNCRLQVSCSACVSLINSNTYVSQFFIRHQRAPDLLKDLNPKFLQNVCAPLYSTACKMHDDRQILPNSPNSILPSTYSCFYYCQQDKSTKYLPAECAICDEANIPNANSQVRATASLVALAETDSQTVIPAIRAALALLVTMVAAPRIPRCAD